MSEDKKFKNIMENSEKKQSTLAYQKAQKRVKDIKNFYYLLIGFVVISSTILYKNWNFSTQQFQRPESIWMVSLWAIFITGYGIYLFVPYFHNWEERKTNELMNKHLKNK